MSVQGRTIVIGALAALLTIGIGFAGGMYFSGKRFAKAPAVTTLTAQQDSDAQPNLNTYDISPPSRATTIETHPVDFEKLVGATASATMPTSEAADIRTGQNVLLYDTSGHQIETLGVVTAVTQGAGTMAEKVTVRILLQESEDAKLKSAAHGEIVVRQIPDSARLPDSALIVGEQGEPYVWEAFQNMDGTTTAFLQRINVLSAMQGFFVIEQTSFQSGDFILNPDDKLRDGQTINVRKVLYAGPPQTEEARIEFLMNTREADKLAAIARKRAEEDGGGCGNASITRNFLARIKKLATPPPAPQESRPAP